MEGKTLEEITLKEFLLEAIEKLPTGSVSILKTLGDNANVFEFDDLNMDEISISAKINRSSVATAIAPLEVLGLVELRRQGQAKRYSITDRGLEVLKFVN